MRAVIDILAIIAAALLGYILGMMEVQRQENEERRKRQVKLNEGLDELLATLRKAFMSLDSQPSVSLPLLQVLNPSDEFHAHLDTCEQCRERPFDLCPEGEKILRTFPPHVDVVARQRKPS